MYCFQFLDEKDKQAKAKGIPRTALKNIEFTDYYNTLFPGEQHEAHYCEYKSIRSQKHELYTIKGQKKGQIEAPRISWLYSQH